MGVVSLDPADPVIRHFPQAQFTTALPLLTPDSQGVCFGSDATVWHMDLEGRTKPVLSLPEDYVSHRKVFRLATHLTKSADDRYLLLDGHIGNHWFVGVGEIATGRVRIIKEFASHYNHAQFSPVDSQVFLIAQDHFRDTITGRRFHYDNRIWL